MDMAAHPLYRDDALVRAVTQWHLDEGHTVFQLFQFGDSEAEHADVMLRLAAPPQGGSVLSLGCGVGGLERHWQLHRPDLSFELVNLSPAQLDLCLCEGTLVHADAQEYISARRPFDVVLMAYLLGHVDVERTLAHAVDNLAPGGVLLVADVFDGGADVDRDLAYSTPRRQAVLDLAGRRGLSAGWIGGGLRPTSFAHAAVPHHLDSVEPAVLLLRRRAC